MRISEQQLVQLLSILDGTITDHEFKNRYIGGYSGDTRIGLWREIMDQQSKTLIDLEYGGQVQRI